MSDKCFCDFSVTTVTSVTAPPAVRAGDARGSIVSSVWKTTGGDRVANDAWEALRDDVNAKGQALPPEPDGPLDELWSCLSVKQQQAVAAGRIDLASLLEAITAASDVELCPRCAADYVPAGSRLGVCPACARKIANERLDAKLAEIKAQREADALKQRIHTARVAGGLPLPRSDRTYPGTNAPLHRECPVCGSLVPDRGDTGPCSECAERQERRASRE